MSSSASRLRLFRARQRDGKIVLPIEVDEVPFTEMLVTGGWLDPAHVDDRDAMARAAARLLRALIEENETRFDHPF